MNYKDPRIRVVSDGKSIQIRYISNQYHHTATYFVDYVTSDENDVSSVQIAFPMTPMSKLDTVKVVPSSAYYTNSIRVRRKGLEFLRCEKTSRSKLVPYKRLEKGISYNLASGYFIK